MSAAPSTSPTQPLTPALNPGAALARNAFHLFVGQAATTALSIVVNAALGRALGPADFGLYYFLMSSTLFAYTVVEWGQPQFLIQEVARSPERSSALLGGALAMRMAGCVGAAGLMGGGLVLAGYDLRTSGLAMLFILAWLPTSMALAYGLVFRGHERMDTDATSTVTGKALTVAAVVPALALGGRLPTAIVALGAAAVGTLALTTVWARRIALPRPRLDRAEVRWLLVGGAPLMVMNVVFLAQNYIETLFLSRLAPAEVLGWYGAARNISGTLVMAGNILVTASFPRLSRTASDPTAFKSEVSTALRPALALAVLAMVGTYLFADLAIGLIYGHGSYGPAVLVLQLLGPTLFLIFVDMMLGIVALAAGKAKRITAFKLVALLLAAALGYPLIKLTQDRMGNGAVGAVLAFAVSEVFMVFAFLSLVPRGVLDRKVFKDLAAALGSGAASVLAVRALPWDHPALTLPVCLIVFAAAAGATGLLRRADLEMMLAAVRSRRR